MKFNVTMKDTDVLYDAINEAIENDEQLHTSGFSQEEIDAITEIRAEKVRDLCSKWFEYGEYLTVQIDTDRKSIEVVPAGDE